MRYTVYLEVQDDGTTMAHVPALPGCVSTGVTQEMALARTPDAITAYLAWLRSHGELSQAEDEPIELEIGGTIQDPDSHLGDDAGLLPTDRAPLTEMEAAQLLRLMSYSRRDLLDLVNGIGRELLHWTPQNQPDGDGWCIDDILEHLARAERVYTSRLSGNVFDLLEDARRDALERMARITDAERTQITQHQGEYWTARKVFRRFLEHEREHYGHVTQVLKNFEANQGLATGE
ncbi:MAG TPA: type II toxin-antitoxin system HicB family antitoxin [Chloroflexia bacterium]|nr:type II toxin-antitoxin system HicB family antitoxin [Chloroflexia bacterium]